MRFRLLITATLLAVFIAACGGSSSLFGTPKISIFDVKRFDETGVTRITGRVANTGNAAASYVEIGVKVTKADDKNYVYASGWTNFTNLQPGESRPFEFYLSGEKPPEDAAWHWVWSEKPGGIGI